MGDTTLVVIFSVVVLGVLAIDLGLLNRKAHEVKFREAIGWSLVWFVLALGFGAGIYWKMGGDAAVTFLTGYVIEQSLSIDNLFVFLLIFASFKTPKLLQHRVLFWGIIGALALRAVCIGVGVAALHRFSWLSYVFGAILIWGGIKTATKKEGGDDALMDGFMVRTIKRFVPISSEYDGERFFTKREGRLTATPLFLTLIVVEMSDLIFAVDSIPAVLAITQDPFLVYTSNVFAILGLRSVFFALAHLMQLFRYLKYALALILIFVGVKIAIQHHVPISVAVTLPIIGALLAGAILASVMVKPREA